MPGPGEHDLAGGGLAVGEEGGGGPRGLGQPQQEFEIGEYGDGVLALHHGVRPQARTEPSHRGHRARPRPSYGADGEPERVFGQRQCVVPVAAAPGAGPVPGGQLYAGDAGQPAGQQLLGDGGDVGAGPLQLDQAGQVLGGVPGVQADEMALLLRGLPGLVVEPGGTAEPSGRLGGEGQGVTGGVAEPGGDLAVAGVQVLVAEQVGAGDPVRGARDSVEDPAEGGGAALHGLEVPEVGVAEPEAEGGGRGSVVRRFQHEEPAAGADEGGSGVQQLVQGGVEGGGAGQPFGEFVQRREIRDPAREPVLDEGSRGCRNLSQRSGSVR